MNALIKNKSVFWLIGLIFLNIIIRLPSLFDPVSYGDECIYLTLGQAFNKGLIYYRDIHDNKPPMLYLTAALAGGKQFWFRIITIAWTSLNILFVYLLAIKIYSKTKWIALTLVLFVLFFILPEGRIPNGEHFMILGAVAGVYLAYVHQKWFLAGIAFSIGFLYKVPVAFDFAGVFLSFFVFREKTLKKTIQLLKTKAPYLMLLGFAVPIVISIAYYSYYGAFEPYVRSALMQNIGYLSSWGQEQQTSFISKNIGLVLRALAVFAISAILYLRRKRLGFEFILFSLWFVYGIFGVLLSERPYPHYLIELVPAGAFLIPYTLSKISKERLFYLIFFLFLVFSSFVYYNFWWYPVIPYYKTFVDFAGGKISRQEWFSYFGSETNERYEIADYIKKRTNPDERVFIWGEGSCIYALSERLPPGKYTVNYHIFDFNGYDETIESIKTQKPNIIVKLTNEKKEFEQLNILLDQKYVLAKKTNIAEIYHRIK